MKHVYPLDSITEQRQGNAGVVRIFRVPRSNYLTKIISRPGLLLWLDGSASARLSAFVDQTAGQLHLRGIIFGIEKQNGFKYPCRLIQCVNSFIRVVRRTNPNRTGEYTRFCRSNRSIVDQLSGAGFQRFDFPFPCRKHCLARLCRLLYGLFDRIADFCKILLGWFSLDHETPLPPEDPFHAQSELHLRLSNFVRLVKAVDDPESKLHLLTLLSLGLSQAGHIHPNLVGEK